MIASNYWNERIGFTMMVLGHTYECILTLISIKIVIMITDLLFTEKSNILINFEIAAHYAIIAIFLISTLYDMRDLRENRNKGNKNA